MVKNSWGLSGNTGFNGNRMPEKKKQRPIYNAIVERPVTDNQEPNLWRYSGYATFTKHILPQAPKESEIRNKQALQKDRHK